MPVRRFTQAIYHKTLYQWLLDLVIAMLTLRHLGERLGSAPSLSLLERASWLDKLPLTLVCGLLLGLSSAGYGIWWLSWVGLVPLILLVYAGRGKGEAALTGFLFGLAYHLVSLRWFLDLYPLNWFGLNQFLGYSVAIQLWFFESVHQALLLCLFAVFIFSLSMRAGYMPHFERPRYPMLLSIPVIWVFLQWVIAPSPIFLGLPIDQLAYSQARVPEVIQIARFTGAPSVDFLIVLFNTAIAAAIMECTNLTRKMPSRADFWTETMGALFDVFAVAVIVAAVVWYGRIEVLRSAAMPLYWQTPPGGNQKLTAEQKANYAPAIPIAVVQGDISAEQSKTMSAAAIADRYLSLSKDLGASVLVLPAGVLGRTATGGDLLKTALPKLAATQKKDVMVGSHEESTGGVAEGVRIFSPTAKAEEPYLKYRLVPFAEYTPLGPLGWLVPEALRERLTGGKMHVRSPYLTTLRGLYGGIGASISSEVVYPDLIVSEVNRGASILINVSDLSFFHNSMLNQQMVAAAALRAVENGRYFVIAANTGTSAVIDPRGVVTSASISGKSGVLIDRVQFLHGKTPFARMCLWTPLYR